jgi:hypothetical protein
VRRPYSNRDVFKIGTSPFLCPKSKEKNINYNVCSDTAFLSWTLSILLYIFQKLKHCVSVTGSASFFRQDAPNLTTFVVLQVIIISGNIGGQNFHSNVI